MNCKQTRENLVLHRKDSQLDGTERRAFLQHLRGCKECQVEYEGLLQTASALSNLEVPEPPVELLGNIQEQIRKVHKRSRTAFFATPFTWLFGKIKLELSPKLVNCAALLCYLIASTFLVKLVFFTDTQQTNPSEENFGLTAMEVSRLPYVRINPSPWASLKHGSLPNQKAVSTETLKVDRIDLTRPFISIESVDLWYNHGLNKAAESVDAHLAKTESKKLALLWNEIKTNL